ncbi:MAG: hypothetical protein ABL955_10575, partial [Elusimicrobiota bacterium]
TWGRSEKLGGAGAKHADLTSSGSRLAAVWDEGGLIWGSISVDGKAWSKPVRLSGERAEASHPRVAAAGTGFRAFWAEKDGYADAMMPGVSSR